MSRHQSELDSIFADAINKHPAEAKSHFEIVDPTAWRVLPAGQANIVLMQGYGWSGPFEFSLDGRDYEVFGRKGQCEDSQKLFLDDWGIHYNQTKSSVSKTHTLALAGGILFVSICVISAVLLSDSIQEERKVGSTNGIVPWKGNGETEIELSKTRSADMELNRPASYRKLDNKVIHQQKDSVSGVRMVKPQSYPQTITQTQQPRAERTIETFNRPVVSNGQGSSKRMPEAKAHVTKDCLEKWKRGMSKYLGLGNRPPRTLDELLNFIGASCPSRKDAWGNPLRYETDGQEWVIASSGEDGTFETDDDIVVSDQ